MNTVAICLWLDGRAEEAATFYAEAFATALGDDAVRRLGVRPMAEDRVPAIGLELAGQEFRLLEGASAVGHGGAASVVLESPEQRESLARALRAGGESLPSGWTVDRFGTAWLVSSPHATARHAVIESPLGPLTLVVDRELLVGIWYEDHRSRPADETLGTRIDVADDAVLAEAASQLGEYFAGTRTEFDLPLGLFGGTFETHVWKAVQQVRLGETASYGDIAVRLHDPRAAHAAAGAIGRNPLSIVVPSHRIIAAGGDLTGYAGGLLRKQWMLDHEAYVAGRVLFDAPTEGYLAYTDSELTSEVRTGLGEGADEGSEPKHARRPRGRAEISNRLPEDVPMLSATGEVDDAADASEPSHALGSPAADAPATGGHDTGDDIGAADVEPTRLRLPRHGAFATTSEVLLDSFPAGAPVLLDATLQLRGAGTAEIVVRHQPRDAFRRPTGDGTDHVLRLTAPAEGEAALVLDSTDASVAGARADAGQDGPVTTPVPVRRAGAAAVADLVLLVRGGRLEVVVDGRHSLVQRAVPADADLEVVLRAEGAPARLSHPD